MKKLVILMAIGSAGGGAWWIWPADPAGPAAGATASVRRGDFRITVQEQGSFVAKESVMLKVQMEVFQNQLTITKVVEAGSAAKKGDVVMEFDAGEIRRMVSTAEVEVQAGKNDVVQTTQDLNIQMLQNRIDLERAQYDFDSSGLRLKKWEEIESPKAIKEADAKIRDALNQYEEASTNLKFLQDMRKEDLVSEAEVKRADLAAQKAQSDLELGKLTLTMLRAFDHPLELKRLQNALRDAKSWLDGKKSATESQTAQKQSAVLRAESALEEKTENLSKLKRDLERMALKAPVDGIVLYGDANQPHYYYPELKIAVGEKVQPHYTLLTIPDLSALKARLGVSEAEINKVKPGYAVLVRPEALPELALKAVVKLVGNVPSRNDRWGMDAGQSRFDVDIDIEGLDLRLKPGMKCKVEISVDEVKAALHVPLDAVFEKDGRTFCFVLGGPKPVERTVKVGRSSADFAEILEGLAEGEKVALYDPNRK